MQATELPQNSAPAPACLQVNHLAHLLEICEEADKHGDGKIVTTTIRRLVSLALEPTQQ